MNPHISVITLGVHDFARAKKFYSDLGWSTWQDYPEWVTFHLNGSSSALGLCPWQALAHDAGMPADGSGFRGITLSYLVREEKRVSEVLAEAERAGATIVKPAERAPWGGTSGVFADPEGYRWKVAFGTGAQPYAE
jgi:catechol 2,3-dioxygenase-like lactoylglutathione lyase family enzyme